jgi:endonuclease YncB( thermonuclease family)
MSIYKYIGCCCTDNKEEREEEKGKEEEEEKEQEILNKLYKIETINTGRYNKYFYEDKQIKKFELNDIELYMKVVDIYDGDTITGIIFLYNNFFIIKLRLSDLDTPEMKPKNNNVELDIKEKALAIICKTILEEYINNNNNIIYIKTLGSDKYGRTLGKIYKNKEKSICFNDILIKSGLCDRYSGGTKEKQFDKMYYNYKQSLELIKHYENNERKVLLKYLKKNININNII